MLDSFCSLGRNEEDEEDDSEEEEENGEREGGGGEEDYSFETTYIHFLELPLQNTTHRVASNNRNLLLTGLEAGSQKSRC